MKYAESKQKIYETTNYNIFVFTDWNRGVSNSRVVKMVESIKTVGWLPEPVLVNDKFEVIDGQSRIKALERLNMPVQFCIQRGVSRKECQALNLFQKNWSNMDFINSYASDGNGDYIWLKEMLIKYKVLSTSIVQSVAASKGKCIGAQVGRINLDIIADGSLALNDSERVEVEDLLFYFSRFEETIKYIGGRKDNFYGAISFMYSLECVDNERVCEVINNARYELVSPGTVEGWLQQIEELYNKKLAKRNKIDVIHEYKVA